MPRFLFCLLVAAVVVPFASLWADEGDKAKEQAATSAAEAWLQLVDTGKYGESWQQSAELFRNAVTDEQWQQAIQAVRKPLGNVVSRKLKGAKYEKSLPGAPDGEYVVVQFSTTFDNKRDAVETITPLLEKDGKWKVSGYFIK